MFSHDTIFSLSGVVMMTSPRIGNFGLDQRRFNEN